MKQVQEAQDASITIDGSNTATTSSSNTFLFSSGSLSGIALEVKSVGADAAASTAKLEIGRSTTSAIDAVGAFVKGFNSLVSAVKSLTSYDATYSTSGPITGRRRDTVDQFPAQENAE
jgi:flagellar capping protein FliD